MGGTTEVNESYCNGVTPTSTRITCPSGYRCDSGACVYSNSCTDTDGKNENITGTVSGYLSGTAYGGILYTDSCDSASSVNEWYCNGLAATTNPLTKCTTNKVCNNGACKIGCWYAGEICSGTSITNAAIDNTYYCHTYYGNNQNCYKCNPYPILNCNNTCADTSTDTNHCGQCFNVCGVDCTATTGKNNIGKPNCVNGVCTDTRTPMKCGTVISNGVAACSTPATVPKKSCGAADCVYANEITGASPACYASGSLISNNGGKTITCSNTNTWCSQNYYFSAGYCIPTHNPCSRSAVCPQALTDYLGNTYFSNSNCVSASTMQACCIVATWPETQYDYQAVVQY